SSTSPKGPTDRHPGGGDTLSAGDTVSAVLSAAWPRGGGGGSSLASFKRGSRAMLSFTGGGGGSSIQCDHAKYARLTNSSVRNTFRTRPILNQRADRYPPLERTASPVKTRSGTATLRLRSSGRTVQIDGQRGADADHAGGDPVEEVMGPDGSDEPVDPEPPGLEVAYGDTCRAARDRHEPRPDPGPPCRGCEHPVESSARDARDEHRAGRSSAAEEAPGIVRGAPPGMRRRPGGAQALPVEAGPLDARVAEVDEQRRHPRGLTVTSPAMKRLRPSRVSMRSAPCRSTPRARPRAVPS